MKAEERLLKEFPARGTIWPIRVYLTRNKVGVLKLQFRRVSIAHGDRWPEKEYSVRTFVLDDDTLEVLADALVLAKGVLTGQADSIL